jgi:hypothetical protein
MRNVIAVRPGNCRSDGYGDRLRSKNYRFLLPRLPGRTRQLLLGADDPANSSSIAISTGITTSAIRTFFFGILSVSLYVIFLLEL